MSNLSPSSPSNGRAKSGNAGTRVAVGCGSGCLGLVALLILVVIGMGFWIRNDIAKGRTQMEEKGLKLAPGSEKKTITVTDVPTEPTYYTAEVGVQFDFDEPVTVPIGAVALFCEFNGEFTEPVSARGMLISMKPGTVFRKKLEVKALVIEDEGATLEDGITGDYREVVRDNVYEFPVVP